MRKPKSFRELWNRGGFDRGWISCILSMLIMLGLWYPTGIAHELGHGIICWYDGGEIYWPWIFKLKLLCNPFPEHIKEISWAMGGSFGVIASVAPIFVFRTLRQHNIILNGFLGCAFMQLGYAIFESTQNELYRENGLTIGNAPIALIGILAIIFFTWSIDKIRERCTRKKSIE